MRNNASCVIKMLQNKYIITLTMVCEVHVMKWWSETDKV